MTPNSLVPPNASTPAKGTPTEVTPRRTSQNSASAKGGVLPTVPSHVKPQDELELLIRARYPALYVVTYEESRVERRLAEIARERKKQLHVWTCGSGMRQVVLDSLPEDASTPLVSTNLRKLITNPIEAMTQLIEQKEPSIYLFLDLHVWLRRELPCCRANVRKVRDVARALSDSYKTMVMCGPVLELPLELEKDVSIIDFAMPTRREVDTLLTKIEKDVEGHPTLRVNLDSGSRENLVRAAGGLTLQEAENVFAKTLVNDGVLEGTDVRTIVQEKQQIIRKSGILEHVEVSETLDSLGGMDLLKQWLTRRSQAFSDEARSFGLPSPRGVMLVGVQGCGKSLCAKAVSRAWDMPLVRFDVGRVFSSLIGSSESNVRRAIATAESIAPVVMWIDEIEKGLAGSSNAGASDGGTQSRVIGTLLTWLNEKTSPVFVVATANDVTSLPPELFRKGRLDEVFFVDLPEAEERERILSIHLKKRKRSLPQDQLKMLSKACAGFSGAEIEQAVVSSLYDAFYAGGDLTANLLLNSFAETIPLSKTMSERVQSLRRWAQGRARPASSPVAAPTEDADRPRSGRHLEA